MRVWHSAQGLCLHAKVWHHDQQSIHRSSATAAVSQMPSIPPLCTSMEKSSNLYSLFFFLGGSFLAMLHNKVAESAHHVNARGKRSSIDTHFLKALHTAEHRIEAGFPSTPKQHQKQLTKGIP